MDRLRRTASPFCWRLPAAQQAHTVDVRRGISYACTFGCLARRGRRHLDYPRPAVPPRKDATLALPVPQKVLQPFSVRKKPNPTHVPAACPSRKRPFWPPYVVPPRLWSSVVD
jgi:hypothetical protein